jgi:hypothetical protein
VLRFVLVVVVVGIEDEEEDDHTSATLAAHVNGARPYKGVP